MTVGPVDELRALAESARAACDRFASEERVRAVAFDHEGSQRGFDAQFWRVLCDQVGVATIAVPERLGGAGYGVAALGVVAHELGRVLAPVPLVASVVLAGGLLVDAGVDPGVLAELAGGDRTAAAVLSGDGGMWEPSSVTLTASRTNGEWTIHGTARHVLNGAVAEVLVVVANAEGTQAVFLLDSAHGVKVDSEPVLDGTRPMATITFADAPAQRLTPGGPIDELVERAFHRALAVLSAEQVGACERVLEIATDYARTRQQFGRPIGSFQAIKHRCADMLVGLEWARSASAAALQSLDDNDGETAWRVSMAKAMCSEALRDAAHSNLQIHGGIGFTWESSPGLYLKRARTDEVLFGGPDRHWDRLAAHAGLF